MPVLVRIAFRNLLEHKAKSLIIGILLALGVVILVVGNSFMDTAAKGVKDTFIGNYTGDLFIAPKVKATVSLFGVASVGGREDTPSLPFHDRIVAHLEADPAVAGVTSQVTGFALVSPKDSADQGFAMLFGIDPATYYRLFQNARVVEGRLLKPGEEGLVISRSQVDNYKKNFGFTPKVGEDLILTGMNKGGFKIRSVPLVGIIAFNTESEATDFISYADVNTVRILSGLTLGGDEDNPVSPDQKALLAANEDSLFGGESVVAAGKLNAAAAAPAPARA
ncbi:MAG TPA: hypothetical protein VFL04_06965, partial [Rectinemataceae bacterium]|nr:hypothetical protein [Rectinemataceae bacterium]